MKKRIVTFVSALLAATSLVADDLPIRYVNAKNYDPDSTAYGSKSGCDGSTLEKGFGTLARASRWANDYPQTKFLVGPGVYSNATYSTGYPKRCVLMDGTVFESIEGPEKTVIVGAAATVDSKDELGNGTDAVPCVVMGSNSILRGFTVTGGHTRNESDSVLGYGGAIWASEDKGVKNVLIENCIITNNTSYGSVCFMGKYVNCVIKDNKSTHGSAVSNASLINCLVTDNQGGRSVSGAKKIVNCTFGPYVALESTDYYARCGVWNPMCPLINSVFITDVDSGSGSAGFLYMTNCIYIGSVPHGVYPTDSEKVANADAIGLDAGYRPLKGSIAVGFGTNALYAAEAPDVDCAIGGVPRILNGNIDAGAYEYDWRADFAAALGPDAVVTNVSSEVTLNDDGKVVVPAGAAIAGYMEEREGNARCVFNADPGIAGVLYPANRPAVAVSGSLIKEFSYGALGFGLTAEDDAVLGDFTRMPIGLTLTIQ